MEQDLTKTKSQSKQAEADRETVLPLIAGPMVWYALAGISILCSLYIFLIADIGSEIRRFAASIFVGLWAPMFGIIGLRAEMLEMRQALARKRRNRVELQLIEK